jgi:hypothetical protein
VTRDELAQAIYEVEPDYESGEYVDGFQVSPGGDISWEQALRWDAEFGDDPLIGKRTEYAYKCADALTARFGLELAPSDDQDPNNEVFRSTD